MQTNGRIFFVLQTILSCSYKSFWSNDINLSDLKDYNFSLSFGDSFLQGRTGSFTRPLQITVSDPLALY